MPNPPPVRENPYTVDALTLEIQQVLGGRYARIQVEGEVTGCRPASSGHIYFTLRGREATLGCTVWRSTAERFRRPLRDGDRVVCTGGIDVYPPQGSYKLIVTAVRFAGDGELLQMLDALRRKLHAEGLFAPDRKRPLPFLPRRIGVVTSAGGAAFIDIVRSIHVRFPARILLAAAPVQGEGAHRQIISAMRALETIEDVDVIVIARGGGSLEDLWEFNQEALVRAIATCRKPVVSAVGHEVDSMLTDFVADARAATPTGVGELVVPELRALTDSLQDARRHLVRAIRATLDRGSLRFKHVTMRLQDPRRLLTRPRLRVDELEQRLGHGISSGISRRRTRLAALQSRLLAAHPSSRIRERSRKLESLEQRLERAWVAWLARARARAERDRRGLDALSPVAVLARGYAIVQRQDTLDVVRSVSALQPRQALLVRVSDGQFEASVGAREEGT